MKQTKTRVSLELLLASFLVLFQELALMRWLPGKVRVLAYFPNLILISSFLGLGIGCLCSTSTKIKRIWIPGMLVIIVAGFFASTVAFTQNSVTEHLWLLYYDLPKDALVIPDVRFAIIVAFILCLVPFIAYGQIVAERLAWFKENSSPLTGYCWDITGSLLGVIAFTILGFYGTFPVVWFAIIVILGVFFFNSSRVLLFSYCLTGAVLVSIVGFSEKAEYYSPYYALSAERHPDSFGISILTNGSLHQIATSLNRAAPLTQNESHSVVRDGYHIPYSLMSQKPKRGLIIGAGTGNDVATMLDEGVELIDAVEIDPQIIEYGKLLHPDKPYQSNKVRIINTDARAFLNSTKEKYDIIIFGTLDSMTRLSALSNVRLDNFVYTIDCLKAAQKLLTANGGVALYFMVGTDYINQKLIGMIAKVFGEVPVIHNGYYALFNNIYMAGPLFDQQNGAGRRQIAQKFNQAESLKYTLPTDDWPFLYLKDRGVSTFYISIIIAVIFISIISLAISSKTFRSSLSSRKLIDYEMFLFGVAFLLLETRSVTAMNLLWGATWLTSAMVFIAILFMVLCSTLCFSYRLFSFQIAAPCLVVALLFSYFFPITEYVNQSAVIKFILSSLVVGLPVFFAGICFSKIFESRNDSTLAFGWNLLGAVFGGLLEFLCTLTGLKALILIALVAYLLAFLILLRKNAKV